MINIHSPFYPCKHGRKKSCHFFRFGGKYQVRQSTSCIAEDSRLLQRFVGDGENEVGQKSNYDTQIARSDKKKRVTVAAAKIPRSDKKRSDNRCASPRANPPLQGFITEQYYVSSARLNF
ncbi:Intermediate filament protein ON3, partial [Frankliniella fusca]